jgi:hypothetical protein
MNLKTTGVLVVLAIIVGVVAYINPFRGDDDDGSKSPWFYQVSQDDIDTIAVTHKGDFVSFHRVAKYTWAFDDPPGIPPNHVRWGGITLLLSGPQTRRDLTEFRPIIENPAQYGLDDPDTIVDVGLTGGRTLQFRLGDPTSDGDHHYSQVIGFPQLFLIANSWGEVISRLAFEPPLPKWYIHRDVESIPEFNIFQGNPASEETPVLQFLQEDGQWKVANIGVDTKAIPVDPERWETIGPMMPGPAEITVAVPEVEDQDYEPWGIVDDSFAIEIRFSGRTDSGTRFTDGNLFRLGNKSDDGTFYYAKSESDFVRQPVLKMDATWTETILGLIDDIPYGELPEEEATPGG